MTRLQNIGITLCVLIALSSCAVVPLGDGDAKNARAVSHYQRAQQAVENRKFDTAYRLFKRAANAGSADALYELGIAHFEGRGVAIDYPGAFEWWSKGAAVNEPRSQYGLGYLYHHGQGVEKDIDKAEVWYVNASDLGHPKAMIALGRLAMQTGQGEEALEHFNDAAGLGEPEAVFLIGKLYEAGNGVDASSERASEYFIEAANLGDAKAQYRLARVALEQDEDVAAARDWLTKAAEQEHAQAQVALAELLEQEDDRDGAMSWYMRAALNGNEAARDRLSVLMNVGEAKKKN